MANLLTQVQNLWNGAKAGKAKTRAAFTIKDPNGSPFIPGQQYFQVLINEMFLANVRQWWVTYDPVVLTVSNYLYGTSEKTTPALVGPSLFTQFQEQVPEGFIIRNAPVTGLHPYQGGAISLTIFLNQVRHANNADKLLQVLESITSLASPLAPAIPFTTYLDMAGVVMDGIETLLSLPETAPVLAYRFTINPQLVGQIFEPTYIVIIDEDRNNINPAEFWVKESRLLHGPTLETAKHYEAADFILLQIAQGNQRTDERTLDFYPLYEKARDLATQSASDHFWEEAKAHFNTLKRSMLTNPDLIKPDFKRLTAQYLEEMMDLRTQAVSLSTRGSKSLSPEEEEMLEIAKDLDKLDDL